MQTLSSGTFQALAAECSALRKRKSVDFMSSGSKRSREARSGTSLRHAAMLACDEGIDGEVAMASGEPSGMSEQRAVGGILTAVSNWSIASSDSEECPFSMADWTPSRSLPSQQEEPDSSPSNCEDAAVEAGPVCSAPTKLSSLAAYYTFSHFSYTVGTSYFARLAARDACLRAAASRHADFAELVRHVKEDEEPLQSPLGSSAAYYSCSTAVAGGWLTAVLLTCVLLAAKVVDRIGYSDLHRVMLARSCAAGPLTSRQARNLEVECLEGLRWRLGPFFPEPTS